VHNNKIRLVLEWKSQKNNQKQLPHVLEKFCNEFSSLII